MTKADLAQLLYPNHGDLTNRDALRLVDLLFDIVKRHLKKGESIHIVGYMPAITSSTTHDCCMKIWD